MVPLASHSNLPYPNLNNYYLKALFAPPDFCNSNIYPAFSEVGRGIETGTFSIRGEVESSPVINRSLRSLQNFFGSNCEYVRMFRAVVMQCLDMKFHGLAMPFPQIQGAFRESLVVRSKRYIVAHRFNSSQAAMVEPLSVVLHI